MPYLSRTKTFFGVIALFMAVDAIGAETNSSPDGAERCIQISNIRRTEVVDDQNILFYMSGKKVYNNHLPHRCNGLGFGRAFKYETSQSQLCNVDIISVISHTTGELVPGASCGLGMFVPTDPKKKTEGD